MEDGMLFLFIGLVWVVGFVVIGYNYFWGQRMFARARGKVRPSLEPQLSFGRPSED